MMKKLMKLWMCLIFIEASTSAYVNPVDCDFEESSCSLSIEGFRMISDNRLNNTGGRNDIMHIKDCNFLDGLCSFVGKESENTTKVNYEFKSTSIYSLLSFEFYIYPGEKCISFKYLMKDFKRKCILIDVQSYYAGVWSQVWNSQGEQLLFGWNEINVTLDVEHKSKILIRFGNGECFNVINNISIISVKKQSCTDTMTQKMTTKYGIVIIAKLSSTDIDISISATTLKSSSYDAKGISDGVIIIIVLSGLAFVIAVILIVTYLYRRRATSYNANISKYSAVSGATNSGNTRRNTDNVETSRLAERLNQTSENVSPYNARAEYSTVLKTQLRQNKTQQRFITGTIHIYPCQIQLLNDENNVTNPEQIQKQYHQCADKDGINSYDTVHYTDNHATEFRDDTYDYTTIHHTTLPDPTYDHSNFKQNVDNISDHSKSGTLNKDMGYLDHSCDTNLQRYMQEIDPTYDHI
ncbi:hypothetical protein ACJMK2_021795 [Sinanodonta woodiana]|uniref:MAM domain-containing protein n=1 Tax=Sinanodonta woodiana TaxID=1069815 RepID=A0ABD3TJ41_SINWO